MKLNDYRSRGIVLAIVVQMGNCGYSKSVRTDTTTGVEQLVSNHASLPTYLMDDIKQLRQELQLSHQTNRCTE